MRDYFVGSLCAIGVFLSSYRGPQRMDQYAGVFAAICAVGVALFPTAPGSPSSMEKAIGLLHFACAASLFLTFAFFCLVLFRKGGVGITATDRKARRNKVYFVCGWTIAACVVLCPAVSLWGPEALQRLDPVFWLESVAIVAFGFSWLTKAEVLPYLWDRQDRDPPDSSEVVLKAGEAKRAA
jgi:cytochrome bd-type quinol oxidase subunit 2